MKKFVIVVWILIATNWYTSVDTTQARYSISLAPVSSDPPPFAQRNNCFQLEILLKSGFQHEAVAEPDFFIMN